MMHSEAEKLKNEPFGQRVEEIELGGNKKRGGIESIRTTKISRGNF